MGFLRSVVGAATVATLVFAVTVPHGGSTAVAAARSPLLADKKPKPPSRLWYRVSIRYSGTEHLTGLSAKTKEKYETIVRRGVELHPQTAVLLRGPERFASPLAFSVLRGRPLLGRVTRYSSDYESDIPGCSHFERRVTARKLGQAQGRLAAEQFPPVDEYDVGIGIVDRDGRPAGPEGLVAEHRVTMPWFCNDDEMRRAGVPIDSPPRSGAWGHIDINFEPCADNPAERCFGMRQAASIDREAVYFPTVRIPSCQNWLTCFEANKIHGARFGTRHFERVGKFHERKTFLTPHGDNAIRTLDETWTYTFTRCPTTAPC
jgi:hypothetical protein